MALSWFDRSRKRKPAGPAEPGDWSGFLDRGVRFEGRLESEGTVRLDSSAKGSVRSAATLILGEHARVEGELIARRAIIAGEFEGRIQAGSEVEIQGGSRVNGEIISPAVVVAANAIFKGECHLVRDGAEPGERLTIRLRAPGSPEAEPQG